MAQRVRFVSVLSTHWFVIAAAAAVGLVSAFARDAEFMASGGEEAILADLCITLPALYAICYRSRHRPKALALRMAAMACSGIWLAAWIIPLEHQQLIEALEPLRLAGVAVIALLEVRLILTVIRLTFSGRATGTELARSTGTPLWVARLMLLEARFWKAVWRFIRRS